MTGAERRTEAPAPRRRVWRWLAAVAVVMVAATASTLFIAWRYARPLTEGWLSKALGAPVTIGTLSVSALRASVSATDVLVGSGDQRLSLAHIGLAASVRALLRGDLVADVVTLEGLAGGVAIDADHRVHVDGLPIPSSGESDSAPAAQRQVTVRRLLMRDVRLSIRHALQGTPQTVNLHVDQGEAQISLALDGTDLRLDGDLRGDADGVPLIATVAVQPSTGAQRIDARVEVNDMVFPSPLLTLPALASGLTGTFSGVLVYRSNPPDEEWVSLDGMLRAVQLAGRNASRFAAQTVALQHLRVNLAATSIDLGQVTVTEPSLAVPLMPDGVVLPVDTTALGGPSGTPQWTISGGRIDVTGGDVTLQRDRLTYTLAIDSGSLEGISSAAPITLRCVVHPQDGGTLSAAGTLILDPLSLDLVLEVSKVALPTHLGQLSPSMASLGGTVNGTITYRRRVTPVESLLRLDVQMQTARIAGRGGTDATARAVKVDGLEVDLVGRRIELGTIALTAPSLTVAFTPAGLVLPVETDGGGAAASGAPWSVSGGRVNLSAGSVTVVRDTSRYRLDIDSARWDGVANTGGGSIQLDGRPADGGTIQVSGRLGLGAGESALVVNVADVKLASLAAVTAVLPMQVARGSATATVNIDGSLTTPRLRGTLRLDDVATLPPNAGRAEEVLAAHQIEAAASIDVGRRSVEIDTLTLRYPYVMIARSAAGVFPYTLLEGPPGAATAGTQPLSLRIAHLQIEGGRADFLDRTVTPQYWTALADIAATVNRVTLDGPEVGDFRITALQDEINPVEVTGEADDKGWRAKVDVRAVFLPSLNVYLAPLLGYEATTGVLSLEIDGHVSSDILRALNQVTLRNVAMTQTGLDIIQQNTGVPLPIALALLKDPSGTINLAVPIEGDPATRSFRLGSLVSQAFSRAVQGALTSPLRLLGLLFGTKGPPRALAVDPIPFAPGSGALDVIATARVEQVARILATHTDLTLVAKPEISAADAAIVGQAGLEELATERNDALARALVELEPRLSSERLVMVPWKPEPDGAPAERSGVYIEMQLSADYGR